MDLDEVIAILRCKEEEKNGKALIPQAELRKSGTMDHVDNWHYDKPGNRIFNGSITYPNVRPSKLSFVEVFYSVYLGLNKKRYYLPRQEDCLSGYCHGEECSFFKFGLDRCMSENEKLAIAI